MTAPRSAARSPAGNDRRSPSARWLWLGVVLTTTFLAAFAVFAAWSAQHSVAVAQHTQALEQAMSDARFAVATEESLNRKYRLEPGPEVLQLRTQAGQSLVDALERARALGDPDDIVIIDAVLADHAKYMDATAAMFRAVDQGDTALSLQIDKDQVDPIFATVESRVFAEADEHAARARVTLDQLLTTEGWVFTATVGVFGLGLALLGLIWRLFERDRRATLARYAQIEQLSRLRAEFVAIVSHEFRTPLTGIQGFSELMRDEDLTVAQMREYAGDINKDAQRLARLIGDMLDLDRMESGQMRLHRGPVDLNHILVDAVAQLRLSAVSHPVDLQLDPQLPALAGDADRLTQVVTNLLNNAIKYSPSGGAIEVRTTHEQDTVVLTVRDHGMGIPADQLETVFVRYARLEAKGTRVIQGTGLGLPIVRQIVEMHGGTVWATSEVGEGSVFHVRLPLSEPAAAARAA